MTRHTIWSPGARGRGSHPILSARINKPHRKMAHALPVLDRLLHGAETFSKSGTWGRRQVEHCTDPARGPSEMGGRIKLAGAEVVGFSAPERGGSVGLGFRGRAGGCLVVGGGRPEARARVAATTTTRKRYNEKSTGPARVGRKQYSF